MKNNDFSLQIPSYVSRIKELNYRELNSLSNDIRKYIIEACSINGGHLSSNLGVVELTVALHRSFNFPKDKLIFDVGHQSYTHKILSGRNLEHLRKENGISGFQKKNESEYDSYEAGHSSTSISAAMGMALDRDINGENYEIIVVIGDSSIANGLAFEALNNLSVFPHKIIIILNDNNQSITKSVGGMHNILQKLRASSHYLNAKEKYKERMMRYSITRGIYHTSSTIKNKFKHGILRNNNIFESLDITYISNIDGHDIKELEKALARAKASPKSVILHVSTIKGKGYKFSENDPDGIWHGIGPFNIETGTFIKNNSDNQKSWSSIYADLLDKNMINDKRSILINPATAQGSCVTHLLRKYQGRAFDVGIAEEHAATFASGIANGNYHPYLSIYSTFLQRSYDEVLHDIARMNLGVTMLIDRAGLVGDDGETHQGIFDASFLMNMPNVAVAMAKDNIEAKELMEFASIYNHPLAIRYPRESTKLIEKKIGQIELGEWKIEKESKDIAIISYGPIVNKLINKLNDVTIINAIFQKPINEDVLKSLLDYKHIVVYDIYGIKEGFCYHILNKLHELNYKGNIVLKGLPNEFISLGTIDSQLERCNLDLKSIVNLLKELK